MWGLFGTGYSLTFSKKTWEQSNPQDIRRNNEVLCIGFIVLLVILQMDGKMDEWGGGCLHFSISLLYIYFPPHLLVTIYFHLPVLPSRHPVHPLQGQLRRRYDSAVHFNTTSHTERMNRLPSFVELVAVQAVGWFNLAAEAAVTGTLIGNVHDLVLECLIPAAVQVLHMNTGIFYV